MLSDFLNLAFFINKYYSPFLILLQDQHHGRIFFCLGTHNMEMVPFLGNKMCD